MKGNRTAWVSVLGYARLFFVAANTPCLYLLVRGKLQPYVASAQEFLVKKVSRDVSKGLAHLSSRSFHKKPLACRSWNTINWKQGDGDGRKRDSQSSWSQTLYVGITNWTFISWAQREHALSFHRAGLAATASGWNACTANVPVPNQQAFMLLLLTIQRFMA